VNSNFALNKEEMFAAET